MSKQCPVCGGAVMETPLGPLFPHKRYVDGGGPEAGKSHDMVWCEGGLSMEEYIGDGYSTAAR